MPNPVFIAILGRQNPDAVARCRLAALRLRKRHIEREMERCEWQRDQIAMRYLRTLKEIEEAERATQ